MVKFHAVGLALVAMLAGNAVAQNAALPDPASPTQNSSAPSSAALPNWVGSLKGKPTSQGCYRKSYMTTAKKCGAGYNFDGALTCWTQCPIEYPVECGMECIPQNQDCAMSILRKAGSVAKGIFTAANSGVFGELSKSSSGVQAGVKCGQQLFSAVSNIVGYIKEVEAGAADTTKDQLQYLLSKSDFAVFDLPVAVSTCVGQPAPTAALNQTAEVVDMVKTVLGQILNSKSSGFNILAPDAFLKFTSDVGVKSVSSLTPNDQDTLKKLVATGVTCGNQIKTVIDKIIASVADMKKQNPTETVDILKFAVLNSNLVLKDLPEATIGCFAANAPEGFKNRDQILKSIHVIIDRVVEASSQDGQPVSADKYAFTIANMGLDAIALFDPTGLANMAKDFVQPICGPTVYVGQITDGPAEQALALTTVQKAFRGTTGTWTEKGDGQLKITFKSADDKDVKVNIMSGGQKKYEVPVKKGETVEWTKPLSEFQGKTLYMDRWRPGFLGILGTGGGSALAWVPDNKDGSLVLTVQINPTSFSDKDRRE
jgi:hypothetical protein